MLKKTVLTATDSQLDFTCVLNAQNKGLKVTTNNIRSDVMSLFIIGKYFTQDASTINDMKINYVLHDYFEENHKFISDMENTVMIKLNLEYVEND